MVLELTEPKGRNLLTLCKTWPLLSVHSAHTRLTFKSHKGASWTAWGLPEHQCLFLWLLTFLLNGNQALTEIKNEVFVTILMKSFLSYCKIFIYIYIHTYTYIYSFNTCTVHLLLLSLIILYNDQQSVIICQLIVHLLVIVQNKKLIYRYMFQWNIFHHCLLKYNLALHFNPSAWGHLTPSSYCDVGRFYCRVFKFWAKLCRSLIKLM
jgi:hypothetical protein